jgi:pSer/pThr/pTyr-binding forkhead associated (FHA) protein
VTGAGVTRDLFHLALPEVVLGRDQGDVVFRDDEYLSPRHALLTHEAGRTMLEDLGSTQGTFVRLRGELELRAGDVLRIGAQLLRFDCG